MENQQGRGSGSSQNPASGGNARDAAGENLPGYPHYNPEEDITATGERVSANMEGVSRANNQTGASMAAASDSANTAGQNRPQSQADSSRDAAARGPRSAADDAGSDDLEADVSDEERMMLDRADQGMDESDDAQAPLRAQLDETDEDGDPLNEAAGREGMLGDDIDVPGSENDDANESIGEEDEENNYYSLGGDEKRGLDDANEGSINRV